MNRRYTFNTEVSDLAFAETSRSNFQAIIRLHLEGQVSELERKILEDWDEAHRDPMKEFATALNTSLADARRRQERDKGEHR